MSDSRIVCRLYQNNIDEDEETAIFKMTESVIQEIQTKSKEKIQEKEVPPETEEAVQPELEPLDISVPAESESVNLNLYVGSGVHLV